MVTSSLRQQIHRQLDPEAWPKAGLSPANLGVAIAVVLCATTAILESEPVLRDGREHLFRSLAHVFGALFLAEWLLRLWAAPEGRPDLTAWRARKAHALSAGGLIDLLALLPFLLDVAGAESLLLRLLRILLLVRLARLGRFSQALRLLSDAVTSRRDELLAGLAAAAALLVLASALLHLAEREAQSEDFGSIPRAMWWAIATLTTVGYGDVSPTTALGKVLAGVVAILGIGLIAMPAGILASAFSEALARRRAAQDDEIPKT
jgi:voltage-gated potassium channel